MGVIIGIDGGNVRGGGGVTHLVEVIRAASPGRHDIDRVVVWAGSETLKRIPARSWLVKVSPFALNEGVVSRTHWRRRFLSDAARAAKCDLLFVPGGHFDGDFSPFVAMSQNLLPFEAREIARFGVSLTSLRLIILRLVQSRTFRRADGVVFLTEYAKEVVSGVVGGLRKPTAVIAHGISDRFLSPPKPQRSIESYSTDSPYKILYVSIVNVYKHQDKVVEGVARLRNETGWPLRLELVGPAYPPALRRLRRVIADHDSERRWVAYRGPISYSDLHGVYRDADLGVFASSCENMPITLLETMASGMPVACSNRGPMPEVVGLGGLFFDPERASDVSRCLRQMIESAELRTDLAGHGHRAAGRFAWGESADKLFGFLASVAREHRRE